jgi:hypothetical protein
MSDIYTVEVIEEVSSVTTSIEVTSVQVVPSADQIVDLSTDDFQLGVVEEIYSIEITEPSPITIVVTENVASSGIAVAAAKLIFTKIATSNVAAFELVRLVSNTHVELTSESSYAESLAVGITLEAKLAGEVVSILTFGIADDPSFAFTINDPLFVSAAGSITDTPTLIPGEFVTQIGQSLGAGSIFIRIQEPEELI